MVQLHLQVPGDPGDRQEGDSRSSSSIPLLRSHLDLEEDLGDPGDQELACLPLCQGDPDHPLAPGDLGDQSDREDPGFRLDLEDPVFRLDLGGPGDQTDLEVPGDLVQESALERLALERTPYPPARLRSTGESMQQDIQIQ